jgi:hypothetical protein
LPFTIVAGLGLTLDFARAHKTERSRYAPASRAGHGSAHAAAAPGEGDRARDPPEGAPRDEAPDTAAASHGGVKNDEPPAKDDGRRLIVRM